jgi:SAM-dependent methyltransferase
MHLDPFLDVAKPTGRIIDFGCGTGRGALAMASRGHDVLLIDFTDNCRDKETLRLPFIQWDLTEPLPVHAPFGYCTDVMEHIPTDQVHLVIANILAASDRCWFQISTVLDQMGSLIGQRLHLTVRDHDWWRDTLSIFGEVTFEEEHETLSRFYVTALPSEGKIDG